MRSDACCGVGGVDACGKREKDSMSEDEALRKSPLDPSSQNADDAVDKAEERPKARPKLRKKMSLSNQRLEDRFDHLCLSSDFLDHLYIASNGGIDEVPDLWYWLRYPFALLLIVLVAMNVHSLITTSIASLTRRRKEDTIVEKHLITEMIANYIFPEQKAYDLWEPEIALAVFELAGVISLFIWLAYLICTIRFGSSECHRWNAVSTISWRVLPTLSSFSGLKVLHYVTPVVLTPSINAFVQDCKNEQEDGAGTAWVILEGVLFVLWKLFLLIFGFDAFMMKFEAASQLLHKGLPQHEVMIGSFLFLNQMLGIVDVDMFTKERLSRFIFGGEDSRIDANENRTKIAWTAIICKKMWETFRLDKFIALVLTFDDMDFQKLMLNEKSVSHSTKKD